MKYYITNTCKYNELEMLRRYEINWKQISFELMAYPVDNFFNSQHITTCAKHEIDNILVASHQFAKISIY